MAGITILHSADWQLGKPYGRIADPDKRALARTARFDALGRLAEAAAREQVALVLVAGDVFDATTVDRATVSKACAALGQVRVPVVLLPGNHDHGGPGSLWHQRYFQDELARLAPQVRVALAPERIDVAGVSVFPCPLMRASEPQDLTAWLRDGTALDAAPPGHARIVLAHGATQDFGAAALDEDDIAGSNRIDLSRLPQEALDYVALGDWHGTKQVGPKAWYAGAHEPDRFPRGPGYVSGQALRVEVARGQAPQVRPVVLGGLAWSALQHEVVGDAGLPGLEQAVEACVGRGVDTHLLELTLGGRLGLAGMQRLEQLLQRLEAQLVRLKLERHVSLEPQPDELEGLSQRTADPAIATVARGLAAQLGQPGEPGEVARLALQELYQLVQSAAQPAGRA